MAGELWNRSTDKGERQREMTALFTGIILDWCFGDPYRMPHIVRLMGHFIAGAEKLLRKCFPGRERMAGSVLTLLTAGLFPAGVWLLLKGLSRIHPALSFAAESFLCYQLLAAKSLYQESMKVYAALKENNLEKSRKQVSMIVGRDTESLSMEGVTKAAVETVAENTADGVIAPLLFMAVFGCVGGVFYKAVNTMDSMIGYKNETYLEFGRTAAKLDDVCNFIPSRLTAVLMAVAAFFLGMDGKNSFRIWKRDRFCHASPNSAQSEAACAGALHVRLAGDAWYFGALYKKPYIGDDDRKIEPEDIKRANRLMFGAEILGILVLAAAAALL